MAQMLNRNKIIFENRQHAGKLLADRLMNYLKKHELKYDSSQLKILALPRGGIPIAYEIATRLKINIDVLVVRKIGAPFQTEFAVGAICEDEEPSWITQELSRAGLDPDDLKKTVLLEKDRIKQQIHLFRNDAKLPDLKNKIAVVVDDGLATGATIFAAIKYLRHHSVQKIIVAVPIASSKTLRHIQQKADQIIVVNEIDQLDSVSQWYRDFSQVQDQDVVQMLNKFKVQAKAKESGLTL